MKKGQKKEDGEKKSYCHEEENKTVVYHFGEPETINMRRQRRKGELARVKMFQKQLEEERQRNDELEQTVNNLTHLLVCGSLSKQDQYREKCRRRRASEFNPGPELNSIIRPGALGNFPRINSDMVKHMEYHLHGKQSLPRDYPDGSDGRYRIKVRSWQYLC